MIRVWKRVFSDHPQAVDETYLEHMRFAGGFAGRLFLASGAALIHALIPCLFEKTASRMIRDLHANLTKRS